MITRRATAKGPFRRLAERLARTALVLAAMTLVGVIGLRITTGADLFDCLYLSVITLTTVGYGEVIELNTAGRWFIMAYLMTSLGVVTYSAFTLGGLLLSPELQASWRQQRMTAAIDRMNGHYIVCGLGRMGQIICEYLHQRQQPFVVIDHDEAKTIPLCTAEGWKYVLGDATDDQTLMTAGIDRAHALAAVLPTDADNVYVTVSAHMIAPKLQIIARASSQKAVEKLQHAGASRVVSPFSSGAAKMARFMLTPNVEDLIEIVDSRGQGLELADVQIGNDSPYVGKTLSESRLRELGVLVVGVRKVTGGHIMMPPGNYRLQAGDSIFAFGSLEAVHEVIGRSDAPSPE